MFGWSKKRGGTAFAVQSGNVIPLEEIPDAIFAGKVLGDGIALVPQGTEVYSPVSGRVSNVADTHHAYGITGSDGVEILVHLGIDTVELGGLGFTAQVTQGQKINKGDLLCRVDYGLLKEKGYHCHTAVIVTNGNSYIITDKTQGDVEVASSPLFSYSRT